MLLQARGSSYKHLSQSASPYSADNCTVWSHMSSAFHTSVLSFLVIILAPPVPSEIIL